MQVKNNRISEKKMFSSLRMICGIILVECVSSFYFENNSIIFNSTLIDIHSIDCKDYVYLNQCIEIFICINQST